MFFVFAIYKSKRIKTTSNMLLCFQGSAFQAASPRSYMRERLGGVENCIEEIMVDGVESVRQLFINCHAFSRNSLFLSGLPSFYQPESLPDLPCLVKRSRLELPGHNHAHQHWGLIHAPRKCANHPNLRSQGVSRQPGNGWDDNLRKTYPFRKGKGWSAEKTSLSNMYIYIYIKICM